MRSLLVVSSLFVLACSGTAPCSTTCTGCCDARGQCKTLTDSSSCGRAGAACTSCSIGQSCVSGACMSGGFGAGTSGAGGGTSGTGGGVSGTGGGVSGTGGGVSGTGGGGGVSGTGGGASGVDCTRLAVQVPTGGCTLSLVGPTNCETVTMENGFIQLAWSTSQTFCEGPHKLYVAGSPVSSWSGMPPNALEFSLTSGTYSNYAMTRNIGGYFLLTQQDLAGLSAVNGQYYFRVASFHDSLSELNTFIVR
ncbi:MAG: hypothetical protein Q8N26_25285 [Myxococcales bacterium]|nr:hypothetical protein [Myxococcales bacterium]